MRPLAPLVLIVLAAPASAAAAVDRSITAGCADRSQAQFPRAFSDPDNALVGPWALLGAYSATGPSADAWLREHGFWKMPVVLRLGRSVTVTVPVGLRDRAGLYYRTTGDGSDRFANRRFRIRFRACAAGTGRATQTDRGPTTFWSGGAVTNSVPLCLPLRVRVAGGPTRTIRVALGTRACSR